MKLSVTIFKDIYECYSIKINKHNELNHHNEITNNDVSALSKVPSWAPKNKAHIIYTTVGLLYINMTHLLF